MIKCDLVVLALIMLNIWNTGAAWPFPRQVKAKRTFILVGPSGVGKSTLGNCLLNRNASHFTTQCHPFEAKDSANGCTKKCTMANNDNIAVIDTVGFGDPHIDSRTSFKLFQNALASVNNRIDGVLFVMSSGRLKPELVDFFRVFQEDVFQGKMAKNSMLICSKCNKGWLQKNRQENAYLNQFINSCNNHSHEFHLILDAPDNVDNFDQETKQQVLATTEESRNQSIRDLLEFIDSVPLASIDLSHVQNDKFKELFVGKIGGRLQDLNANISESLGLINMKRFPIQSVVMTGISLVAMPIILGAAGPLAAIGGALVSFGGGGVVSQLGTAAAAAAAGGGTAAIGASAAAMGSLAAASSGGVVTAGAAANPGAAAAVMAGVAALGAFGHAVASNPATKLAITAFVTAFKSFRFGK